jgi:hypothetical protein
LLIPRGRLSIFSCLIGNPSLALVGQTTKAPLEPPTVARDAYMTHFVQDRPPELLRLEAEPQADNPAVLNALTFHIPWQTFRAADREEKSWKPAPEVSFVELRE